MARYIATTTHLTLALSLSISYNCFAADRFIPEDAAQINEPQVYIAPIELSNSDLRTGDVKGYRPWFENGAWQGDLIELDVDTDGTITSTVDLSVSPPTSEPNSETSEENWSARIQFADA